MQTHTYYIMALSTNDYEEAAKLLNCEIAMIKAITRKEAHGEGFFKNGKIKILFEGHQFYKRINNANELSKKYPNIVYKKWVKKYYLKGELEYNRFNVAFMINPDAAMKSTSWGMFQIMGFNHKDAGYNTVNDMVDDYKKGEKEQLLSFCRFCINTGLDTYIRNKDFKGYAYNYNGALYYINQYDTILEKFYNDEARKPS